MIIELFNNLSMKFRNENALSDITWTMCETSENFRKLFLGFFFPTYEFNKVTEFRREYSSGGSRPDFFIKNNDDVFLIEVKIYDTNHHFDQYTLEFDIPKSRLGYITNYNLYQKEYSVKTWKALHDYLLKKRENLTGEEMQLVDAYLTYITSVCSIIKIENKMDLKHLQTVIDFNETLKDVTNFETETFRVENYKQDTRGYRTGYYFRVTDLTNKKPDIWIWLGAWFGTDDHQICIEVESGEGWGKPFYDVIDPNLVEKEDNAYLFYPKYDTNHFNSLGSYDDQRRYLKDFVIEVVEKYLNK